MELQKNGSIQKQNIKEVEKVRFSFIGAIGMGLLIGFFGLSFGEGVFVDQLIEQWKFPYTRGFLEEIDIILRFFIPFVLFGVVALKRKKGLFWYVVVMAISTGSILWIFFSMSDSVGKEFIPRVHYYLSPMYALLIVYFLYRVVEALKMEHFFLVALTGSIIVSAIVFLVYYLVVVYPYKEIDRVFNRAIMEDNANYCDNLLHVSLLGRASTVMNECFWNYAQYKQDTSFCNRITVHSVSDTYVRNECFSHNKF